MSLLARGGNLSHAQWQFSGASAVKALGLSDQDGVAGVTGEIDLDISSRRATQPAGRWPASRISRSSDSPFACRPGPFPPCRAVEESSGCKDEGSALVPS